MRSAPHDPLSLPVRLLALGSLAGLTALTLVDRGATRMFATPWTWLLAAVIAAPVAALLLRAISATRPLRLPATAWLAAAGAVVVVAVASALASPYRGASLLSASIPVGAVSAFLLLHDWLASDPEVHRLRLERIFALGAGLVALASAALWIADLLAGASDERWSQVLRVLRNPHTLGHPNYTAGLALLGLPWLALAARRAGGAARVAAVACLVLTLFNLFTSGSRGGLLGLAALGVAGVAAARVGWKKFLLIGAGAVVVAGLLAVANPRIRAMLRPGDPAAEPNLSNVQRSAMVQAGLLMTHTRPALGWGPGTTPLAYPRFRHDLAGGAENVLQLHCLPIQVMAETGAAGLLATAALVILVAAGWRRSPVAAVTLAGYGIFALTDYQLDVPVFAAASAALLSFLARPAGVTAPKAVRTVVGSLALGCAAVIAMLGQRDPAPRLNAEALALAREPAQHDRAAALLRQSLALNPDQEIAHFNLGWLLAVPDPGAAEKHFLAAAHLVPDKGGVYFGLGLARLNQGQPDAAARAFALECVNDPLFIASPWWSVPQIAALRGRAAGEFARMLAPKSSVRAGDAWVAGQKVRLLSLASRLGQVSPGPEKAYRRVRIGYPVLMRDLDLTPPEDLYDVREDPRFPESVPFPLPSKGWLPSPELLNLLDAP